MNKKIFKLSFLFLVIFVLGSFFAPTALAARKASVTISPTVAFTEENIIYTYKITNANDEETTAKIGSIEIEVPSEFETPSANILSTSSEKTWILDSLKEDYKIRVKASGANNKLDINESIEIQVVATAPATPDLYKWTASVFANLDFTSNPPFTLSSEQPAVNISVPAITLSNIAITTPATKLNYTVGDTLDISGLIVTGTYSDNSTQVEVITPSNITGFDSSVPANGQILTITVGEKTTTYTIDIIPAIVHLNIETSVDVPTSCNITDTNGVLHNYPQGDSYLAICALGKALEQNAISDIDFADFGFGLFINSVNNISQNNTYWQLRMNNISASVGVSNLTLKAGDIISLVLTALDTETSLEDKVIINVRSLVSNAPSGGGNGGGGTPTVTFDIQKALTYLKNAQSDDGSFGESLLYTDWAAIAFGALNVTDNHRDSILAYFNSNNTISPTLTDNERRAMALLALGQNPHSFNGVNYVYAIASSFDGTQFGDFNLVNDDIFALIPLANSGYTASDDIIIKNVAFIISKQNANGSWENNVDLTAVAIQALNQFKTITGIPDVISKAIIYLQNAQGNDGGWGNIYSTSWAIQAESALNTSWSNGKTGIDYLTIQQTNANNNGAMLPSSATLQNNIWATSYAIAAASGKSWSEIMQLVSKPAVQNNSSANSTENINPQKPADPVVCPKGDLFSITTGQACTTFLIDSTSLTENAISTNSAQANSENTTTQIHNVVSSDEIAFSELQTDIDTAEIIPDTLTATAIKTLPIKTIPQTIPIVLGTLSGLALLYLIFKFFIIL